MEEETLTVPTEVTRDIVRAGQHVLVVARHVDNEGWLLTIVNDHCVMSTWHEFFASAEEALREAERAIEVEGIEAFTDCEGFELHLGAGHDPQSN
jgi:hypothetical protein